MKKTLKYFSRLLIALLALSAASFPCQAATLGDYEKSPKVIVLNYHKIDDVFNSLSVYPKAFEAQLKYLKENGFQSITLPALYAALNGKGELPKRSVLITFDDGYSDNYTQAFPLLKKYGFTGVIFVVTSFLDQKIPGYLTWEMAKEMQESGVIDIESHTVSHQSMTDTTDEKLRYELTASKKAIEDHLGKPVEYVAYPTGTYNLHIAQIVKDCGYKGAFTIKYGNADGMTNLYAIERLPIFQTSQTYDDFIDRIQYVPAFDKFGWLKS